MVYSGVTASVKMIRFSYSNEDIKVEEMKGGLMAERAHGLGAAPRDKPYDHADTPAVPRQVPMLKFLDAMHAMQKVRKQFLGHDSKNLRVSELSWTATSISEASRSGSGKILS
jgi:hypothetical protein